MRADGVEVAAPVSLALDVAGLGEVGDDPLGSALGDVEEAGDVAYADPRVVCDQEQCLAVVCEEGELRRGARAFGVLSCSD